MYNIFLCDFYIGVSYYLDFLKKAKCQNVFRLRSLKYNSKKGIVLYIGEGQGKNDDSLSF